MQRIRLYLHRLLNRHRVVHYTDHAHHTRGVCACGWEGSTDRNGRFI